jgi:ribonuclease T2
MGTSTKPDLYDRNSASAGTQFARMVSIGSRTIPGMTSIQNRRLVSLVAAMAAVLTTASSAYTEQEAPEIITLVWWPDYCHPNRNALYCSGASFRGFVLGVVRNYPESPCQTESTAPLAIDPAWLGFMPDPTLLNRQWIRYGVCSGAPPHEYFAGLDRIYRDIGIPPRFIRPDEHFARTTSEVKREFAAVNRLEDIDVGVNCERDFLSGVTIRKTKRHAHRLPLPSSCPKGTFWVIARMPPAE